MIRPGTEFPARGQEARLDLSLVSLHPQLVPADVVPTVVLADLGLGRLQRVVRGVEGNVEQKGVILGRRLLDVYEAVVAPHSIRLAEFN